MFWEEMKGKRGVVSFFVLFFDMLFSIAEAQLSHCAMT